MTSPAEPEAFYPLNVLAYPTNHNDPVSYTLSLFAEAGSAERVAARLNELAAADLGKAAWVVLKLTGHDLSWVDSLKFYVDDLKTITDPAAWEETIARSFQPLPPEDLIPSLDELPPPDPDY